MFLEKEHKEALVEDTKRRIGKANRAAGARFELRVRKGLEDEGWIVDKWTNNVKYDKDYCGLIKVKNKFLGHGKPMMLGAGFPDFVAFRKLEWRDQTIITTLFPYEVIGVESKMNGYLDKTEKEKCQWLIENHIFSKILIASKGKKRGTIKYEEYK